MPSQGIFTKVVRGGVVEENDSVEIVLEEDPSYEKE